MESEITNTILGILRIPAWLEALLAVVSISFILWLGWRKAQRQNDALNALEEASKMQSAVARNLIIMIQNRAELDSAILDQSGLVSDGFANRLVRLAIDASYSRFIIFAKMHKDSHELAPLARAFRHDAFLEFSKALSGVKLKDGTSLSDFARLCVDEFDFWEHGVIHNLDLFAPCDRFKLQMDQKWRSYSGLD